MDKLIKLTYEELAEIAEKYDIIFEKDIGKTDLIELILDAMNDKENEIIENNKENYEDENEDEDESLMDGGIGVPDKFVLVPPFKKRLDFIENVDKNVPGFIKIGKDGKLLKRWFEYEGKVGSLVETYDNWIINVIEKQLKSYVIYLDGGEVTFDGHFFLVPRFSNGKGSQLLYPQKALNEGITYSSELYTNLVYTVNGRVVDEKKNVCIGKIPVMLGSVLDNLRYKSPEERRKLGMCINDPNGYFIIKSKSSAGASDKVILIQENMRLNKIYIFNSTSKGEPVCRMTVNTDRGQSVITLGYDVGTSSIRLSLPFMGKQTTKSRRFGNSIAIFHAFVIFGITDTNLMTESILKYTKDKWKPLVKAKLRASLLVLNISKDPIPELIKTMSLDPKDGDEPIKIKKLFQNELFPHIPFDDGNRKLNILCMMIARYAEFLAGLRTVDDRDHWGNKRLESAGRSMERLFGKLLAELVNKTQKDIHDNKIQTLDAIKMNLTRQYIENAFIDSFRSDNWGVPGKKAKENITDTLKRDNPLAALVHVTKINVPTNRRAKQPKIRQVHSSQTGYVCPSHTPEGEQCLTLDTLITLDNGNQITLGELIKSHNDHKIVTVNSQTLEQEISEIIEPFSFHSSKGGKTLYRVETINGYVIKATNDHPFLVSNNNINEWVKVVDLKLGDNLVVKSDEEFVCVKIVSKEVIEGEMVADFTTISKNHSFIANGFVTHNCGLVKNSAITNWISIENDGLVIYQDVKNEISNEKSLERSSVFWMNGQLIGWCNGEMLKKRLIVARRKNLLPKGTAIVLDEDNVLNVFTDGARPTRPLLIVGEDGILEIEKKNLWNSDIATLMREGCLEYIDAYEQDYILLAMNVAELEKANEIYNDALNYEKETLMKKEEFKDNVEIMNMMDTNLSQVRKIIEKHRKHKQYSHCELHPSAYLGVAASMIPFSNFNPGPRISYACSHMTQAVGVHRSNHTETFDTTAKCLSNPTVPLVMTEQFSIMNSPPKGVNVTVAIMIYTGFNQEDSIIINRAALDRGLFRMTIYKGYKTTLQDTNEEYKRPIIRKGEESRYSALREDGLPIEGSYVRENDYIIGKVRKNEEGEYENISIKLGLGQYGIIDSVLKSGSLVRVKIRQNRKPEVGDKFASRHAQKATIGLILNPEDMPFDPRTGEVPDIIVNPHSIPSRMTIAWLIELLSGLNSAVTGEFTNATAHRPVSEENLSRSLQENGFDPSGNVFYVSGITGKPLKCQVFRGICYYMALRHIVQEKIQYRGRGMKHMVTGQPIAGRGKGGAIRFGEMERDSLISHGASATLLERLCIVSDAFSSFYCTTCGTPAVPNLSGSGSICKKCTSGESSIGVCEFPYITRLFINQAAAAGFKLTPGFKKIEKK